MGQLGDRLTEEMKRQGISAAELARQTGVKEMTLRRIMWGQVEDPGVSTLAAIARGLNRRVDFFIWDEGESVERFGKEITLFFRETWPKFTEEEKKGLIFIIRMVNGYVHFRESVKPESEAEGDEGPHPETK